MNGWIYQQNLFNRMTEHNAVCAAISSFPGILLEWYQALSQEAKNAILRPATNVNDGSTMITLVGCLYMKFVGKSDGHVEEGFF